MTSKFNFTKTAINNLQIPPKGKRKRYYDTRVPCLELSITEKGAKTFNHYAKINGRPERTFLGTYPRMSIEQARAKTGELNAKVSNGENPAQAKRNIRAETTLGEFFAVYTDQRGQFKRSWANDKSLYGKYLSQWGHRKLSDIRKSDVLTLHITIGKKDKHPHQANRARALLHTIYEFATEHGYEGTNPCKGIKKYPEPKRDRFLHKEELPTFFNNIMNDPHPYIRDFILVCLCTGARSGNVQSMRWDGIDWNNAVWHIPITKSGEPHTVPLAPFIIDVLRERRENVEGEWVFPSLTIDGHIREPKVQWHRICEQASIDNLHIHDLRRTLGSWMAQTGASLLIISGALGHKLDTSSVTAVYSRLDTEPIRKAMGTAIQAMLIHGGVIEADVIPFRGMG